MNVRMPWNASLSLCSSCPHSWYCLATVIQLLQCCQSGCWLLDGVQHFSEQLICFCLRMQIVLSECLCACPVLSFRLSVKFKSEINVTSFYSKTNKMHQCLKFISFWVTLHVLDGLSVHRQEFKTVHTATGICQTDTANCLVASSWQYLFDICLLWSFRPSSGVQDCTYNNRHLSDRYCQLLASKQLAVSLWHMPVAVFLPIIRSSGLYVQQQAFVIQILTTVC